MAARFDARPERVLARVNKVLREQSRLSLVTVVCALVETNEDRARLTVASAGHPLPLLRRSGGAPDPIGRHGVLLGVEGDEDWTETAIAVNAGDTLLFYTDGVTETPGDAARFGEPRLCEAMARAADSPAALLAEIDRSLRDFQAGETLDDRAMLALRFVGHSAGGGAASGVTRLEVA
jgi:serine phosphatase RsbU (regulator of sigma subunit)